MNVSILLLCPLHNCSFEENEGDQGFASCCLRESRDVLAGHGVCSGVVHARHMQDQIPMMLDERDPATDSW